MRLNPLYSCGFMLIEVMVGLLLLSLGVSAWLGAQAGAQRQSRVNQHLSLAMVLAADLADRLRASPAQAQAMASALPALSVAATCSLGDCAAAGWAAADAAQWRAGLQQALPQGSAQLQMDGTGHSGILTLVWREPGAQELAQDAPSYLRCSGPIDGLGGWRCLNLALSW